MKEKPGYLRSVGFWAGVFALLAWLKPRWLGLRSTIELKRTVYVEAPVETAFDFWKHFANFPRFMSFVREVTVNDRGGFTWRLQGPGGAAVSWESAVLRLVPNQVLSWRSLPGALVRNEGSVQFRAEGAGRTRVAVRLTYAPPAGVLGVGVLRLLGFDPRQQIDGDLRRMKEAIEQEGRADFDSLPFRPYA